MKIVTETIKFKIHVDFEGSDVDMVFRETVAQTSVPSLLTDGAKIEIDETKLTKTPVSDSVDFALNWLAGFVNEQDMSTSNHKLRDTTELEALGLEITETHDLIMGTCYIECECPIENFSTELVTKANKVVEKIFKKFVVYYK